MNSNRCYPFGVKCKITQSVSTYNLPLYKKDFFDEYFISFFGINKINVAYWGKLIKTDIIKSSKFEYNNLPIGEDLLFSVHLFPTLQSAMFIDYYGYNYRFGGITSSEHSIPQVRKIIIDFIELYRIKSKFAQEINYEKAYRPMFVELKNILLSNFSCIAKYKSTDARAIEAKNVISEILNIKDYSDNISSLLHHERYANDNFIKAISNNDIETIYKISHANYKKDWKKRLLKRCLRLFS